MKTYIILFLLPISSSACLAQNSFTLGAKIGYGTSAFPMNVNLESNGSSIIGKSGAIMTTGLLVRYTIADQFGIESGVWLNHYSFYHESNFTASDKFWKTAAALEVINYQMPMVINYKLRLPRQSSRYFSIGAGTTLDWFLPYWHSGMSMSLYPRAFQNIVGSLKLCSERPKGNNFEIGIDTQYSLKQFNFSNRNYSPDEETVIGRLNIISLSIGYFFLKKEMRYREI